MPGKQLVSRNPHFSERVSLIAVSLLVLISFSACSTGQQVSLRSDFYVFRLEPPALVEISAGDRPLREIPFSIPVGCELDDLFPSPRGPWLAIELGCSFGQAVVWFNTDTDKFIQAVTDSDSHFLAWTPDGQAVYLKVNSINRPKIVRVHTDGAREDIPITELTYDLAPLSDGRSFIFSFSRGMGLGSEMDLARSDGASVAKLASDPGFYLSWARWSPDGKQIAFIKIPDSPTPFTVGGLWVMSADGSNARKLAEADAGHEVAAVRVHHGERVATSGPDGEMTLEVHAPQGVRPPMAPKGP